MWDLPRPGIETASPALAGGFLTTVPPGKSLAALLVPKAFAVIQDAHACGGRTLESLNAHILS